MLLACISDTYINVTTEDYYTPNAGIRMNVHAQKDTYMNITTKDYYPHQALVSTHN